MMMMRAMIIMMFRATTGGQRARGWARLARLAARSAGGGLRRRQTFSEPLLRVSAPSIFSGYRRRRRRRCVGGRRNVARRLAAALPAFLLPSCQAPKLSHPYFKSDYNYCCCCGGGGSGGGFITSTTSLRPKLFLQILLVIALYFCYLCGSPNAPPRAAGSALRCGAANCWRESFG